MSEPAKVRLVRCPKCQNLLPEVTDYSVYQCGACGAVLRANNKYVGAETFSEKSDEDVVGGISEKLLGKSENLDFVDKRVMKRETMSDGSENDVMSSASSFGRAARYRSGSVIRADKFAVEHDLEINKNTDELGNAKMTAEFEDLRRQNENAIRSQRSRGSSSTRSRERGEMEGLWRTERIEVEDVRYSSSKCSEEGPSRNELMPNYGYEEPAMNMNDSVGKLNTDEYLEQNRAELLKKLEELNDQLSRSCDVTDIPKQKFAPERRIVHQDPYGDSVNWLPNGSLGLHRASMQYPLDQHVARPPHISPYAEPSSSMSRQTHTFYPPMHIPNQIHGYGDPYMPQLQRRGPLQVQGPFQQHPPHSFYSGHYTLENDMVPIDSFETFPRDIKFHDPSCSCFHCYNKYHQVPPPAMPVGLYDKRFPNVPNDPMFPHLDHPGSFGLLDYNRRIVNPLPVNDHNPQSHTRRSSDLNSEVGVFIRRGPPRVVLATGGEHCRPIAGGAPFVTCYSCFELLQLPKKVLLMDKIQTKLRCGACSTVILFELNNKRLLSAHAEAKKTSANVDSNSNVVKNEGNSSYYGSVARADLNFSSEDYDNSGYVFQSIDGELYSSSAGHGFNVNKSAEMKSLHSTSSGTSEDENDKDSLIGARKNGKSAELAMTVNGPPPAAGSPLLDHFDYPTKYNRSGKGNRSGRSEPEKIVSRRTMSRQNSMKDESLATEIDISSNEYGNTGTTQGSSDASRGEDQLRPNKRAESFFQGIFKKSFRDFSRKSSQTVEEEIVHVTINGHPIPERFIKKAEKLAGQIDPGEYWYDSRAGFWGVIGGPCLGIIPPFIEEFNYPMPENCSGGTSDVFVNGRELREKDMKLLGNRGLPPDRGRSYIIEISGRVVDEDTGEELQSLGKLAPTVEKLKHGFGMRPRAAA